MKYLKHKFKDKVEFINIEAQLNINGLITTPVTYKYYYGINSYRELDNNRNSRITVKEYLRYSAIESWKHIIQYQMIREMQPKFIIEIYKDLKKCRISQL